MTDASTRPDVTRAVPTDPPPPPPPAAQRGRPPDARWSTVALIMTAALLTNLSIQGRPASFATFAAVVTTGLLIAAAPARRTPSAFLAVGLAVGVASNLVLRASDWVVGPTLVAALTMLGLAVIDRIGLTGRGTVAASLIMASDGIRASLRHLVSPIVRRLGPAGEKRLAAARGTVVAVGVVTTLTLLLANADAVLGEMVRRSVTSSVWSHVLLTAALLLPLASASAAAHRRVDSPQGLPTTIARPIEATMGLGAMVGVLAAWVVMQVTIAAGGADRLLTAASVTRAGHAREGFFELVVVVAVVLTLLSVFGRLLPADTGLRSRLLVVAAGGLTIVLVGVTYSRLSLYTDAFGLTMLRLSVAWFLGWLTLLVLAVTAWSCGVGHRRAWLTTFALVSATLVVGAFGWSNPEATVAATNLARDNAVVALDVDYLTTLGADAAPTLRANGIEPGIDCSAEVRPFGPLGWNRSWATACPTGG